MIAWILCWLLGERRMSICLPATVLDERDNVFTTSKGKKYVLAYASNKIYLSPRNRLASLLGLWSIYYFVGCLDTRPYSADEMISVQGDLLMKNAYKTFLLVWFALVFLGSLILFFATLFKVGKFFLYPGSVGIDEILIGCGVAGGSILVLAFGILILKLIQAINIGVWGRLGEEFPHMKIA